MRKRVLSAILSLSLVISLTPVSAGATIPSSQHLQAEVNEPPKDRVEIPYVLEGTTESFPKTAVVDEESGKQGNSPEEGLSAAAATSSNVEGFLAPIEEPDADAVKISSPEDLQAIGLTGSYVLAADIDMSSAGGWSPIGGSLSAPFRGKLDGQGHTIRGLKVESTFNSGTLLGPCYSVGMFGVCDGAEIQWGRKDI